MQIPEVLDVEDISHTTFQALSFIERASDAQLTAFFALTPLSQDPDALLEYVAIFRSRVELIADIIARQLGLRGPEEPEDADEE